MNILILFHPLISGEINSAITEPKPPMQANINIQKNWIELNLKNIGKFSPLIDLRIEMINISNPIILKIPSAEAAFSFTSG